jgi:hypothetical protein
MGEFLHSLLGEPDAVLFLHGACHVFALELNGKFNYTIEVLLRSDGGADHAYCRFDNAKIVDVSGIQDEQAARKNWADLFNGVGTHKQVPPQDLWRYFKREDSPDDLRAAHHRAKTYIEIHWDHFSGKDPTPIQIAKCP